MTETRQITERPVRELLPYPRNARRHSKKQIRQIAASIERFGFTNPVLVSDAGEIIAGHGGVEAARLLGMKSVPTVALSHLSEAERRAYVLADNKLALNAGWDQEVLALELQGLIDLDFDLELTGFSLAEIDLVLDEAGESASDAETGGESAPEDRILEVPADPVSRRGDLWQLRRHRLLCGDARKAEDYKTLLGGETVGLVAMSVGLGVSCTTLIAAQKTGRRARLIEYDPAYVDTIIRRYEAVTGKPAVLAETGETFEDVAALRRGETIATEALTQEQVIIQ